jgi:hypothetical protein
MCKKGAIWSTWEGQIKMAEVDRCMAHLFTVLSIWTESGRICAPCKLLSPYLKRKRRLFVSGDLKKAESVFEAICHRTVLPARFDLEVTADWLVYEVETDFVDRESADVVMLFRAEKTSELDREGVAAFFNGFGQAQRILICESDGTDIGAENQIARECHADWLRHYNAEPKLIRLVLMSAFALSLELRAWL